MDELDPRLANAQSSAISSNPAVQQPRPAQASLADAIPDARGANFFTEDAVFARLLSLYTDDKLRALLTPRLERLGELAGDTLDTLAGEADRNGPTLVSRSRRGEDVNEIHYHPAYRQMEALAFGEFGLASMSHRAGTFGADSPLPPVVKYALTFLFAQSEFGLLCPVSMTDSLARTLKRYGSPELIDRYLPRLGNQDMAELFQGAMFMTEQGAGSDVSATAVSATPGPDNTWTLHGDKWFCSNADADVALVLARRQGAGPGLKAVSLFLLPKVLPDGSANQYRIVRLKDKLGTRSMASGEIRLEGATAWLIGDPEAGFRQMADMVNSSRLSNGVRSAGMMRRAVFEAFHGARHRQAFGRRLIDMPLMRRQLAKMLMPAEQARTMFLQCAREMALADGGDAGAASRLRVLTPLLKYRACRDARKVVGDAMEVRGGCGYIEEWPEPRLLRDAHLGSIWEGTSNIVALDVLRAVRRDNGLQAWRSWVEQHLQHSPWPEAATQLPRVVALVEAALLDERLTRSAAAAMYNLGTAVAMHWEADQLDDASRAALARLVLAHRLTPKDPLAPNEVSEAELAVLFQAV